MQLTLNDLEVECIIGERAEERTTAQTLHVDLVLEIVDAASISDQLTDTVDYVALADKVRVALVEGRYKMIERAARIAAEVCLTDDKVRAAKATVTKSGAIAGLKSASAVFEASK